MKNAIRFLGIITLVVVIGLSVIACGNGNGNGNGNNGTGSGGLTITNMDAYIGSYIELHSLVPPFYAAEKVTFTHNPSTGDSTVNITPTKITSGTVRLNVWRSTGPLDNLKAETYTGNYNDKMVVWLYDLKQGGNPMGVSGVISEDFKVKGSSKMTVAFIDGKATLNGADINWEFY